MTTIKTKEEIEIMREAGRRLALVLEDLKKAVRPGIKTMELNRLAESLISKQKGTPCFKGYDDFPAAICTSVNDEIVHAVPSARVLKEGDILTIDAGLRYKGYDSDMAFTLPVGKANPEALRLLRVTKKALKRGVKKVRPGNTVGDLGNAIQRYVESQGFSIIKDLCGHGIGKELQEDPKILNYGKRGEGEELKEGMVICIEPIVSMGDGTMKEGDDGFSFVTGDGSLSAHFEHMMAITSKGARVLTEIKSS
jgi:methionyl aminopeptidase